MFSAAQQYAEITTSSLQTLNSTLATLASDLKDIVTSIENQKNADLITAQQQLDAATQNHEDNNTSIQINAQNERLGAAQQYVSQYNSILGGLMGIVDSTQWSPVNAATQNAKQAAISAILQQNAQFLSALQNRGRLRSRSMIQLWRINLRRWLRRMLWRRVLRA